jgi:phenylalanyl-tRNA synthetase beta chain
MKVTLNWLKQYTDFEWAPEVLAERLTMLGIEVEGVEKISGSFEGIVVAQVITRDKHPNADKLSLCRVNDGKGERQIVCGAQNFKAGDKVPLILPGSTLPALGGKPGLAIKVGKIRGVESQGMLCSPQELGLSDQVDGLLLLKEDAPVGQPFSEYLGRSAGDVIYDLEITPNRPDLNSVIGIAREIAAITGNSLRMPSAELPEASGAAPVSSLVSVRIEDSDLCPRYTARVVRNVKIAPSPDWLRATLEKVGVRSINNVVDVTNYVMLETGQPLHAFDYRLLGRVKPDATPSIVVRRAMEGEKFQTLDEQQRVLTNQMLLIADDIKPLALAGVMGGLNSEIKTDTVDVLVESAYFKPQNVRATSRKLELRTESSYRFERGADIGICDWASRRAVRLIIETAGGVVAEGVADAFPKVPEPKQINLSCSRTNALLGIDLPAEKQIECLKRLGLQQTAATSAGADAAFHIPSFRVDLKSDIDLIEEITRVHGIENIPATPPRGAIGSHPFDAIHDELSAARNLLAGLGLFEAQGQTLISETSAHLVSGEGLVPLANPLSSDMNVLRPSLLPGLLDALRHNLNHKTGDVGLFELGRVFSAAAENSTLEQRRLALALTGQRNPLFWSGEGRDAKFDVYDLKGIIEEFLEQFGLRGFTFARRDKPTTLFIESATVQLGKLELGQMGQLSPILARRYDLRDPVFLAELDVEMLLSRRNRSRSFKSIPALPAIRRDVAMLVPEATTHESVLQAVRQAKPANLESVDLFDVFRGKNVPAGQKSMAYAFTYRSAERSLTDVEVNAAQEKLIEQLKQRLQASIRD